MEVDGASPADVWRLGGVGLTPRTERPGHVGRELSPDWTWEAEMDLRSRVDGPGPAVGFLPGTRILSVAEQHQPRPPRWRGELVLAGAPATGGRPSGAPGCRCGPPGLRSIPAALPGKPCALG